MHFYRPLTPGSSELCFNIEVARPLSEDELKILRWLLAETYEPEKLTEKSSLLAAAADAGTNPIEIGPRLNYATPSNTNALSILASCGLEEVITRLEVSRRSITTQANFDRMTECIYQQPLQSFSSDKEPEKVYSVPLLEQGLAAFHTIDGLSMDAHDKQTYYDYFVGKLNRNPTIVEIMDLNNANSEHSRHGYFKGKQIINGQEMPETLMDIVKSTLSANPGNSLVAFCDNSSVISGAQIWTLVPENPGRASKFVKQKLVYHILFTAETHNFPTGVAPFPGAQTGTGGRIRDVQATGRGGLMLAGTVGYAVGNLLLDKYELPWEKKAVYPDNLASAQRIIIEGSNGATRYGNEIGEPVIQGFFRAGASYFPDGSRSEWLKPILFTGGVGQIDDRHLYKQEAETGMLIIEIGGPAYRIGFGGGAASSLMQGENKSELDFNAVQRGDAEMEQKMNRVVRACIEMGDRNPIISIHDQGAGGPANVLKELVENAGGIISIRAINCGDKTMSVLEIWVSEYQERNALLISPSRLVEFQKVCDREKVPCEYLGEVTGNGIFSVFDNRDNSHPVLMKLQSVLGGMPQKTFKSEDLPYNIEPLILPPGISVVDALSRVLRLASVGSKRFLTNKGDRSVTGLIAQQQCCGPHQLTVSDVAVVAQSYLPDDEGIYSGAAISIGEQPIKMLVSPEAGARMAVAEALSNMVCAKITKLRDVKCSANWMGAPKLPGEGARLYRAADAMRNFMIEIGIAVDGGKDSLSMATKVNHDDGEVEIVKSPLELVISAYCTVPDITKVVTPDIKYPGESKILHIDLSGGKCRLGGSALAQVYNQIGDESPDVENAKQFVAAFNAIQTMINKNLISACHDISDGGLIVCLLEMLFAGNCGCTATLDCEVDRIVEKLFAEEIGWLVEYLPRDEAEIFDILRQGDVPFMPIGYTGIIQTFKLRSREAPNKPAETVFAKPIEILRRTWEETSFALDKLQCNPDCVLEESENIYDMCNLSYKLSFSPQKTKQNILLSKDKPRIAIIREEGSNGDREMMAYFEAGGFEAWDINIQDLLEHKASLSAFRGIAFVGGFSYADVLDSAKGWAAGILFNPDLRKMFDDFYNRPDTFSLSVCNGCQLAALLGWVPFYDVDDRDKIRFIKNKSGRFESRFSNVGIYESPAIMLKDMAGSVLGVWSAHGEGLLRCSTETMSEIMKNNLAPICYVDDIGERTESYPFNPNGSQQGITGICDKTGRHLAMMPHPERSFLKWQWAYLQLDLQKEWEASPWIKMVQNAYDWCMNK